MSKPDIFDHVIEFLEHQKRRGVKTVNLDPGTVDGLFANAGTGTQKRVQAVSPPQSDAPRNAPPRSAEKPASSAADPAPYSPAPATHPGRTNKAVIVEEADPRDWDELREAVLACPKCRLSETRTHAVFGEGSIKAPVMFIGEGPGYHEDQSGRPFVGRAGELLTRMISAMQFAREDVYITNIVKCRPPGNRNPQDDEAAACLPYLNRQIDIIKPKIMVLLGAVPLRHLLGLGGITKIHGTFYEYRGIPVCPTYHPSFLLRSPQRKTEAWEDLQKVMRHVGKDPEATMRAIKKTGKE